MQKGRREVTNQIIATIQIKVKTNEGCIILPGKGPIMLTENPEVKDFTIPDNVELYDGDIIRVGRDKTNDIVLDLPGVSRFHAIFTAKSSSITLLDSSSTNGTIFNGVPISAPVQLVTECIIEIGPAKLMIEFCSDIHETDLQTSKTMVLNLTRKAIVTVLVVDVCGYTQLTEHLPIKDVIEVLQHWSGRVSKIIQEHGGEVDKYIGDCVMAFWHGSADNAKIMANKAAKASMEIIKDTQKLSKSPLWIHRDEYPWDCRVSLNTGEVMMGAIGTRGSRDFSVWGDVVNISFRLNAKASELGYNIIISDSTANYIKDSFELKKLGPVKVKGRNQEVVVYALV